MSIEAMISIAGMVLGGIGIVHVLMASRRCITSADPDPQRVQRFVETAPPLPERLREHPNTNEPDCDQQNPGAHRSRTTFCDRCLKPHRYLRRSPTWRRI